MHEDVRVDREEYTLTTDQVAAAFAETVLRAQIAAAQDPSQGGASGTLLRVDRAVDAMEGWILRLILAGIPLAVGVFLLVVAGNWTYGVLAIATSPVVLFVVIGAQRGVAKVDAAIDANTDPLIAKAGGSKLRKAIEAGRVQVLRGNVVAGLAGDRLSARTGELDVTIPSVRAAWRARAASHLVIAASPPGARPDFSQFVLLPSGGEIATAIARDLPPANDPSDQPD